MSGPTFQSHIHPDIHPTAIVDSRAELAADVQVGPYCTVGPHVRIGAGTRLMSHVVVDGHTEMGKHNIVFPFAVIGAVPQDLKYKGEPTRLTIGDHNTIRESVTLNLGTVQGGGVTSVGSHNLLMAYTHLGHDCHVANHCIIANQGALAGHVTLEDHVTLGGMCGVSQFVRVGAHAYIGGQSGIEKNVPPYTIALGMRPCAIKGTNIVGLKRRGFSAETIRIINEAIKLWTRQDVQKEQCLLEIESQWGELPEIKGFVKFIRDSDVGTIR
jgi:UDP-N-acetylglucosamine acyltransferase